MEEGIIYAQSISVGEQETREGTLAIGSSRMIEMLCCSIIDAGDKKGKMRTATADVANW